MLKAPRAGVLMILVSAISPALAADDDTTACQRSALEAEQRSGLPPGLLMAIGMVESGRRDPATGRMAPWPWTIDANGVGQAFDSLADALAATRALQARGVTSIDVGCFQINLHHHPFAFASLEQAFDPGANAAYAASFLSELHTRTGTWEDATAAYHSSTPGPGGAYRDAVLAGWTEKVPDAAAAAVPVAVATVWRPSATMRIWTPDAPGQAAGVITIQEPDAPLVATTSPAVTYGWFGTGRYTAP